MGPGGGRDAMAMVRAGGCVPIFVLLPQRRASGRTMYRWEHIGNGVAGVLGKMLGYGCVALPRLAVPDCLLADGGACTASLAALLSCCAVVLVL